VRIALLDKHGEFSVVEVDVSGPREMNGQIVKRGNLLEDLKNLPRSAHVHLDHAELSVLVQQGYSHGIADDLAEETMICSSTTRSNHSIMSRTTVPSSSACTPMDT
jgi:hypothetical protein